MLSFSVYNILQKQSCGDAEHTVLARHEEWRAGETRKGTGSCTGPCLHTAGVAGTRKHILETEDSECDSLR